MVFLAGMNAIVTGASRGIGKAIAETLASFRINLCLAARNPDPLNDTTVEIIKKYGVKVIPVVTDVAKLPDLENLVKTAKQKLGGIDILVNNAGVSSQYPFEKQPVADFESLVHTNYLGYVRLIRLVINDMIKKKAGIIINMISGSVLCDPCGSGGRRGRLRAACGPP